jgi:osmoprotectant transport system ATP-binding protein
MMNTVQESGETTNAPPLLAAEGVGKRYGGTVALAGVNLEVSTGECVALVGESGSGKTTLLRCFNRTVVPEFGKVRVAGRNIRDVDPVRLRRGMGFVQQEGGLLPHWRVGRNAAMVPWLLGQKDSTGRGRRALAQVGLDPGEYADRWPHELSGGQRQRVAIARALAGDPGVVLLDEPFGALDAITRSDLHALFAVLRRRLRLTVVLVTHDLREAALLADRIAVLQQGRLRQVGSSEDLVRGPADEYVRELLDRAGLGTA